MSVCHFHFFIHYNQTLGFTQILLDTVMFLPQLRAQLTPTAPVSSNILTDDKNMKT